MWTRYKSDKTLLALALYAFLMHTHAVIIETNVDNFNVSNPRIKKNLCVLIEKKYNKIIPISMCWLIQERKEKLIPFEILFR